MMLVMTNTAYQFIPAADIAIGDAVVESDGYLLAVTAIKRERGMLVFTLANDFSPIRAWRSDGEGITMRKRASTRVAVVRGAGRDVLSAVVS